MIFFFFLFFSPESLQAIKQASPPNWNNWTVNVVSNPPPGLVVQLFSIVPDSRGVILADVTHRETLEVTAT